MTQGHDAGAGQGGDVDDGGRLEALGVGQRVAQHQAALGVGIEDLDGQAGHAGDHVAWLVGLAAGQVFAGRDQADHVQRQFQFGQRAERAEHAGGAAHVVLHFVHGGGGLERDAAGVEGDALADQHDGAVGRLGALLGGFAGVAQDDEAQRFLGAARHRQERAHAQGLDLLAVHDLDLERLEFARQALGGVAQVGGGADIARQVAQGAGQFHAVGDGGAFAQALLRLAGVGALDDLHDLLELGTGVAVGLAEAGVVVIGGAAGGDGRAAGAGDEGHVGDGVGGQGRHAFGQLRGDAGGGEGLFGGGVGAGRVFVLLAQADQDHALGRHARQGTQHQGRAGTAAELALGDGAHGAVGGAVDQVGGGAQHAVGVDPDRQRGGFDLVQGSGGLCAKFHEGFPCASV